MPSEMKWPIMMQPCDTSTQGFISLRAQLMIDQHRHQSTGTRVDSADEYARLHQKYKTCEPRYSMVEKKRGCKEGRRLHNNTDDFTF